jgi:uncharacterized protein with beta-barrel porin domain
VRFQDNSSAALATITNNAEVQFNGSSKAGNATLTNHQMVLFDDTATAADATFTNQRFLWFVGSSSAGRSNITNNFSVAFLGSSSAGSSTIINNFQVEFQGNSSGGTARLINGPDSRIVLGPLTSDGMTLGSIEGAGFVSLNRYKLTVGGNNLSTTFSGTIRDDGLGGSFVKVGNGTLTLTGNSSINGGISGGTTVEAGGLTVNGSLTSNVTVNGGTLSGVGSIIGTVTINSGEIAPGNSIGNLNINGGLVTNGGFYEVEIRPDNSDDIILTGPGGRATINGGIIELLAAPGTYSPNTTYTIMTASQGVTGAFPGVTEDFAFLTPTLSYDANNVYLSLVLGPGAFASAGQTANQQAVGRGLDAIVGSGNLGGIVTSLASLRTAQGAPALQALSPEPYADFGTVNTRASQLFMSAVARQMAGERGGTVGSPKGVALAEACDIACDDTTPRRFSAWLSGIGSLGSVLGDGNASGLTYTLGGTAFGIDYRLDPRFLIGIAGGYVGGSQWVNGFGGNGYTDSLSIALYGSFTQNANGNGFYADALAGYANSNNRLQRVLAIPGQSAAVANGQTNANQFLGQVETGYKIGLPFPANTSISPFGRLQIGSVNQAGFTESGTSLFNLSVAQQTTTSVRTTFGADFGASFDMGGGRPLDIGLRLGWMHEFADTARPISAAFAAAPVSQFTVFGATPQRDSAVIGFSATTAVTDRASLFASYDGEVGGGTDNHALRVGFRMTW